MKMTVLEARLQYAADGWWTFPAPRGQKKSHKSAEFSGGERWGATLDADEIRRDMTKWPDANVSIATGGKSRFFVVEADTLKGHGADGIAALQALQARYGALPPTRQAQSPSGSLHCYF